MRRIEERWLIATGERRCAPQTDRGEPLFVVERDWLQFAIRGVFSQIAGPRKMPGLEVFRKLQPAGIMAGPDWPGNS